MILQAAMGFGMLLLYSVIALFLVSLPIFSWLIFTLLKRFGTLEESSSLTLILRLLISITLGALLSGFLVLIGILILDWMIPSQD